MQVTFTIFYIIISIFLFIFYYRAFTQLNLKRFFMFWFPGTFATFGIRLLNEYFTDDLLKFLSFFSGLWMFFIYYSMFFILLKLLYDCFLSVKRRKITFSHANKWAKLCIVITAIAAVYGVNEAYSPIVRIEEISSPKIKSATSVVLVSDIHAGTILGKTYVEGLVKRINDLNADFVLINGDIIDYNFNIVKRQESLYPLQNIKTTSGRLLATLGNHDYYDKKEDLLIEYLKELNVKVLSNEKVSVGELTIIGLKDYSIDKSIEPLNKLYEINDPNFKIVLDHQPHRSAAASAAGYDLYLAGHTHGGAFFPNQLLTSMVNDMTYGRKVIHDLTTLVTSGYGFFGIPIRIGAEPEIVLIKLKPESK